MPGPRIRTSSTLLPGLGMSLAMAACANSAPAAVAPEGIARPTPSASIAIGPAEWATEDSLLVDVHGAMVRGFRGARVEAVDTRAEMERRGEACAAAPDCADEVARALGAEKVVHIKLATLGGTVLVRISVIDVASGTRNEERQEVVSEATPERVNEAITALARGIADPYRPPPPTPPKPTAWYEEWWVWTLVGAAVVGTGVGVGVGVATQEEGPDVVVTPP